VSEQESQAVQVSKAVAAQLSAASKANLLVPDLSFNAKHWTLPVFKREDFKSLIVTTRPRGDVRSRANRALVRHEILIETTIRQLMESDESLQADKIILLAEKIADFWEKSDSDTGQTRTLTGRNEVPVMPVETTFEEETLQQHRMLKCVITQSFLSWR
jgi:hypothetical protein